MRIKVAHVCFGVALATLGACANPSSVVRNDIQTFKAKYPNQIQSIVTEDRRIRYAWSGDPKKTALLFVHGSPGSWEGWAHFLLDPNLAANYQLIAVDRPGYGGSGEGYTERSLEKQAELIFTVLQANQSGLPAILVGHSYGGPVIAKMAMSHPERVAGLVFVAASVDPGLEKTDWYQYPADWWPIRELLPSPLKVCNQEIFALRGELTAMLPYWKNITAKVVTIQGQEDNLVPPANQDFLLRVLAPNRIAKAVRVPGLNHFIPWKRPELILDGIAAVAEEIKKEKTK